MFFRILKHETGESQEFNYLSEAIDWAHEHGDGNYTITDKLHMGALSCNCRVHAGQLQLEGKEY